MKKFDTVVIGGGPGGYVCAIRLAQLGKKVGLVEKENVGGVCLNVGCIPSKAMIHASEFYAQIQKAEEFGFSVKGLSVDIAKLQAWKEGVVRKLTGGVAQLLRASKVEIIKGGARFKNKKELIVKTASGEENISFDTAVIATGSSPIVIPGFAIDKKFIGTSTEGLNFAEIPGELCVIGGGYIGLEIGSLYAALGSKVTVVEATASLLPGVEADLVQVVARELKHRGVTVYLNTKAISWKPVQEKAEVTLEKGSEKQTLQVDKVLVAVGRTPNTKNLNLEGAGVGLDPKGFIKVNDKLQTHADGIYAIGDCAGQPMLAHKASKEGLVAAAVIAGKKEVYDVRAMPAVIFTTPEIATVGFDEAAAKGAGFQTKVGKFPFAASGKALASGETDGFVKIIADAKTDRILGVAIVGHDASNLIGEACLAIEMGATAEDLARTVHPHPTLTESLMEGAEAIHGNAIHIFQR